MPINWTVVRQRTWNALKKPYVNIPLAFITGMLTMKTVNSVFPNEYQAKEWKNGILQIERSGFDAYMNYLPNTYNPKIFRTNQRNVEIAKEQSKLARKADGYE